MAASETDGRTATDGASADAGQLIINAQYVKDLSFENPRAPQSLVQQKGPPDVSIGVDVKARTLGPELYEVLLAIKAEAKSEKEALFICELTYGAVLTVKNAPNEVVGALVLVQAPQMIFPFARAVIANATRDGGFPPLLINPIDFHELLRRQQASGTRSQESGTEAGASNQGTATG